MRVVLQDEDMFGDPNFLGQATFPLNTILEGRAVAVSFALYCGSSTVFE